MHTSNQYGQMAERLNAPVLKTGDARAFLSSNLSLSAMQNLPKENS